MIDKTKLGSCQWCGEDAFAKVVLQKARNAPRRSKAEKVALVCDQHAASFARQGLEVRR